MSFMNKFKSNNNEVVPPGVNLAHTSFGYKNQQPYTGVQPQPTTVQKSRPRGGWDDDDEEDQQPQIKATNQGPYKGNELQQNRQPLHEQGNHNQNGSGNGHGGSNQSKKKATEYALVYCDEAFIANHEYENNMILELIQPGGARLKQPEKLLNDFCKACENFQTSAIGSLLLTRLNEPIPDVSKARTLFLIEAIVKKVPKFFEFFKYNLDTFKGFDFSQEGMNAGNLEKLQQDIIQHLEGIEQPKQTTVKPVKITTPITTTQTANLLEDDDLLGISQPQAKQDSFSFVNKQQGQTTNPTVIEQPKKFDPFAIGGQTSTSTTTSTSTQNTTKPSSGPSINFKKFQAGTSQEQAKPTGQPQTQNSQQMNSLIGGLEGLDFGGSPTTVINPNSIQNTQGNPGTNGQSNLTKNPGQGVPQNQNKGFTSNPPNYPNNNGYNFPPQNNPNNSTYPPTYGANNNGYNNNSSYHQNNQPQGMYGYNTYGTGPGYNNPYGTPIHFNNGNNFQGNGYGFSSMSSVNTDNKGIDELYNLVHQELRTNEDQQKKKQKEKNEQAFDSLKF